MTYSVDWIARARRDDDGTRRSIEAVLWLMGSPASDLWPEKARARRVLTLVAVLRPTEDEIRRYEREYAASKPTDSQGGHDG